MCFTEEGSEAFQRKVSKAFPLPRFHETPRDPLARSSWRQCQSMWAQKFLKRFRQLIHVGDFMLLGYIIGNEQKAATS